MSASVMKRQGEKVMVQWRLRTHFEVDRHVPSRIDVTRDGGGNDERAVLNKTIEPDRLYVRDRGYAKFKLFNEIVAAKSSDVCRLRDNSVYDIVEDKPLTEADQIVLFGKSTNKATDRPQHPLRLVIVKIKPHLSKGKYQGVSSAQGTPHVQHAQDEKQNPPDSIDHKSVCNPKFASP